MKFISYLSLLSFAFVTSASDVQVQSRFLQERPNMGKFCRIDVSVKCVLTGTDDDCTSINPQPYGTCGPRFMTMKYKFCNLLDDLNILPLRLNPTGEEGTVAMYRQEWGRPELLLGLLPPGKCREEEVTAEINTCKKRIVGDLKFEGWVDGQVDVDGYYCYGYEFLDVPFFNLPAPQSVKPSESPITDVSLSMSCIHTTTDGNIYDCESLEFSQLSFSACSVLVEYTYDIINHSNIRVRLDALVDENLVNMVGGNDILDANSNFIVRKVGQIDICESGGEKIEKKGFVVAGPLNGAPAGTAKDDIQFTAPLLPWNLNFDGLSCEVEGTGGLECNEYAQNISSKEQCYASIKLKYTFTKIGIGCVDIEAAKGSAGALGTKWLAFDDYIPCDSRELCSGESITIPDRRYVNLCEKTGGALNPWDLMLEIQDTNDRTISFPSSFSWASINIPQETPAPIPAPTAPVPAPTAPVPATTAPTWSPVALFLPESIPTTPYYYPQPAPTTPYNPQSVPTAPTTSTGVRCTTRPEKIKFSIQPIACRDSKNSFVRRLKNKSSSNKNKYSSFSCEGNKPPSFPINFSVFNRYDNLISSGTAYSPDDVFYFGDPVPSNVVVKLTSESCDQTISFHSSCSKPIYTGDKFGSVTLVDFVYDC